MLSKLPLTIQPIARLFILQQFFSPMVLLTPVYLPAMVDYHFTAMTISALMCCLYITSFIFEIPSGVWADQYSRRKVLMLAEIICALGFAVMGLFPTVLGFAIGLVGWALRSAMYSGTHDAYIYDELTYHDGIQFFGTLSGYTKIAKWIGVTISSVGVWVYHDYSWALVAWLSVAARLVGFILLYIMPEVGKVKTTVHTSFKQVFTESFQVIHKYKAIMLIGLYSCSFSYLIMLYDYRTLLAQEWHIATASITFFVACYSMAYCLGSVWAAHWRHDTWVLMLSLGVITASLALLSFFTDGWLAASAFVLSLLTVQFWLIRISVMQQHITPSHVRASTGSIINFGDSIQNIVLAQFIGFAAGTVPHYLPPARILGIIGFIISITVFSWFLYAKRKEISAL